MKRLKGEGLDCSILYNRGVYPEESFVKVKKYGLPMLLTEDEEVKSYIASITSQLSGKIFIYYSESICSKLLEIVWSVSYVCLYFGWKEWLEAGKLQRIVLVIMSKATSEVLERWNFNIETDAEVIEKG